MALQLERRRGWRSNEEYEEGCEKAFLYTGSVRAQNKHIVASVPEE
jgi:hypothetical protein